MQTTKTRRLAVIALTALAVSAFIAGLQSGQAQKKVVAFAPTIPKTWVDAEIADLEVPLAQAASSPTHVPADYYYRIKERKVYKTYPIYAPGKEPAGYFEWLQQQEPEIVFDPAKLKTEADWIAAFAQEVKTDGGLLAGSMAGDVRVYKGIPYAAPPVGKLRWRPPQPAAAWQGVRDATKFSPACPQARSADNAPEANQSEDCLCLNVYTAAKTARERRPVMVWIHGGGLNNGSSSLYDGAALARKGVIVVTINYRLNVFGFLAHPALSAESAHKSSGNVGLLDQIAALEWVRRNIAAFGGDANNVTIFGESAGSWSVNLLLATPLSKGLFHRAIGESGGEFEPNPHLSKSMSGQESAEAIGARVLARLGCGQVADPLACAREKKTEDVLAAIANGFRAQPCVDGWFLPAEVHAIFAARKQHPVPVIVGFNADEGAQFAARMTPATAEEYTQAIRQQFGAFADEYLMLYPAGNRDVMLDSAARRFRDERHTWKMLTWARMMEPMKSGVWLYYFTQVAPDSRFGAHHAAEIIYVFDNLHRRQAAWTEADKRVAHAMSSYWVNFAKTGDPNGAGLLPWPRYETKRDPYIEFGPQIKSKTGLHPAAFAFWDKYFTAQRARRQEAQ